MRSSPTGFPTAHTGLFRPPRGTRQPPLRARPLPLHQGPGLPMAAAPKGDSPRSAGARGSTLGARGRPRTPLPFEAGAVTATLVSRVRREKRCLTTQTGAFLPCSHSVLRSTTLDLKPLPPAPSPCLASGCLPLAGFESRERTRPSRARAPARRVNADLSCACSVFHVPRGLFFEPSSPFLHPARILHPWKDTLADEATGSFLSAPDCPPQPPPWTILSTDSSPPL